MTTILRRFIKSILVILKKQAGNNVILSHLFIKLINSSYFSNSYHVILVSHRKEEPIGYFRVYFV